MCPQLPILLLLIASTAGATRGAHRQAELKSYFEVFEFDSFRFESRELSDGCLGPPYLYVTGHHKTTSVLKFTRDGCFISDDVLIGGPDSKKNFRSMAINTNGELIIANAADEYSQILVYRACNFSPGNTTDDGQRTPARSDGAAYSHSRGQRAFQAIVTDVLVNPGAEHPYGLTLDADQARPPPPPAHGPHPSPRRAFRVGLGEGARAGPRYLCASVIPKG
jgi:hypothetical protein